MSRDQAEPPGESRLLPAQPVIPSDGGRYSWYVVTLLMLMFAVNMLDRQVINILSESIKQELKITDTQLGLLTGTAFGVFYSVLGLPLARWADRHSRVGLISVALTLWSSLTAACGLVSSYGALFMLRLGVGVGEAGGGPPAQSLISDYIPHRKRAMALSIYNLGLPLGSFAGFIMGGVVNQIWGWRAAFLVAGIPGLVLALLIRFTVKEPVRGQADGLPADQTPAPLGVTLKALFKRRSFVWLVLGSTCGIFVIYVTNAWFPPLFIRLHGLTSAQFGGWIALSTGLGGGLGVFGGGLIADALKARAPKTEAYVPVVSTLLTFPLMLFTALVKDTTAALAGMFLMYTFAYVWVGPASALIQRAAPVRSRALAHGIQLFVANIIALAGGPPLVGLISDALRPQWGQESIRYALAYVSVGALMGTLTYILASRHVLADAEMDLRERQAAAQPTTGV